MSSPTTHASSRTLLIVLAAGGLLSVCLLAMCAGVGGWIAVESGVYKKTDAIEGKWVRSAGKNEFDHAWTVIEFKRNGVYVVQPGNQLGKYKIENSVVTFETGLGFFIGEFDGNKLRVKDHVYDKQQ